tara:strand:+ start:1058 stop:1522 length:465 start_codon:yes stop_codon:yes gene_type:complete
MTCQHDSFEDMCQERNDLVWTEDNNIRRSLDKQADDGSWFEINYNNEWVTINKLFKIWGGDGSIESGTSAYWKCNDCGKTGSEMYNDVNDIDPTTRVSQQPHGKRTHYCNLCNGMVEAIKVNNEECCPYHQRTIHTSEGDTFLYDDMDQDGERL